MHDARLRAVGLPVGSGVTEGACQSVIKMRTNGSSQRWRPTGLEAVLTLRSMHMSDRLPRELRTRLPKGSHPVRVAPRLIQTHQRAARRAPDRSDQLLSLLGESTARLLHRRGLCADARTPAARGGDRLCSHPGDLAAGPAAQTGGPRRRLGAPHRPPPADRHPGPPRVAAHRPRARRPPRLARTFAPPSRVTGLRETAHGGAVRQAARNGPSAQSFDQRGLHSTAATSDPSFAIRSHRPGNRSRTLYE